MAALEHLSERDKAVLRSIFDPTATIGSVVDDGDTFEHEEETTDAYSESATLCAEGIRLAETGRLEEALEALNKAVSLTPDRAAAYNDRAQLLRLMEKDDDAMTDLDTAIKLKSGTKSYVRALALCQKGLVLRKRGADDAAREAFAEAAKLGSGFAKKQIVELNPYAALCNKMLSQVMRGEKNIKL